MVELHRHNYDHHFNHKYEDPVSPEPKLQNYLPTRRKVREARPWWRRCCSLCLSNCEFVTVFALCLAVFLVFLYLFASCELTNRYISSQLAELNNVSQVEKTSLKTGKADIHIFVPGNILSVSQLSVMFQEVLSCNGSFYLQIRRSNTSGSSRNLPRPASPPPPPPRRESGGPKLYFPLRISADPASVATLTNSVADCTMFLILLAIFGTGEMSSFK